MRKNLFATTPGIIIVGAVIGLIAVWLQKLGNPANMGICVACFERDVAGGLGLHRAAIVQYLRPEIMGLVLGSLAAAIATLGAFAGLWISYRSDIPSGASTIFVLTVTLIVVKLLPLRTSKRRNDG